MFLWPQNYKTKPNNLSTGNGALDWKDIKVNSIRYHHYKNGVIVAHPVWLSSLFIKGAVAKATGVKKCSRNACLWRGARDSATCANVWLIGTLLTIVIHLDETQRRGVFNKHRQLGILTIHKAL